MTCAAIEAYLLVATDYAKERAGHNHWNPERGFRSAANPLPQFNPHYADYASSRRTSRCDSQGVFEFREVPDGDYYAATSVYLEGRGRHARRISMQRVRVSGGETKRIVFSS